MAKQAVNRAFTQRELAQFEAQKRREAKMMKDQVDDLEMKARYWKAQFDIRHYTLEAEKLQPEYEIYMEEQRKKNEELQAKWEAHQKELEAQGAKLEEESEIAGS